MNTISFSPVNISNNSNVRIKQNPAFTATPKVNQVKQGAKDIKQSVNFIQKLYKALFIPSKESVVKMENGNVYTESSKGATVISKRYGMWKSKPSIVIEHNEVTGIANKKVMNGNGTYSLEIRDMHTPEYRISAGYENVSEPASHYDYSYAGGVNLRYCDKTVAIPDDKRLELLSEFGDDIDAKFSDKVQGLLKDGQKYPQVFNEYCQDADVIAHSILESPQSLNRQLQRVPSSLPYGIERILAKIEK